METSVWDKAIAAVLKQYPKRRITITVEVDLDPVPGWGNDPDDFRRMIESDLKRSIPHYHPVVAVGENPA